MKRPKQLPAVDRNNSTKTAAVPVGANVRPSFSWDPGREINCGIAYRWDGQRCVPIGQINSILG